MSLFKFIIILTALGILASQILSQEAEPSDGTPPNRVFHRSQNYSSGSDDERFQGQVIEAAISNYTGQILRVGTAYSTAECYTLTDANTTCPVCLRAAHAAIKSVAPVSIGARYFLNTTGYSCYLHFEQFNFGPGTRAVGSPAAAPAPPELESPVDPRQFLNAAASSRSFPIGVLVGVLIGGVVSSSASVVVFWFCIRNRRRRRRRPELGGSNLPGVIQGTCSYKYRDLETATGGFNEKNKLGQGAFGTVYKGTLKDGSVVAVKQLDFHSKQGQREFLNEISIITNIKHRNLVKLEGYCIDEDDRLLVYEYLPNKSLDKLLFGDGDTVLDWPARMQIINGIANGLTYLHEQSQQGIIHRDIKASNILLDDKLQPKISDFGISKLFAGQEQEFTNTVVAGTFGYLAPEYLQGGRLTTKADVYSFGVLALEIVSGRKCVAPEKEQLLRLAWRLEWEGQVYDIIDKKLDCSGYSEEIVRVARVALACTLEDPSQRPSMSQVVVMLAGYKEVDRLPRQYMSRQSYAMDEESLRPFSDTSNLLFTSSASNTEISTSLSAR